MKKKILTLIQVAVTLAILWFIFKDPQKRADMAGALKQANLSWLLWGFIAYSGLIVCGTIRWGILLKVQGICLNPFRLSALFMVGLFFNFFMPGGTGGDVIKILYLLKETPGKRGPALLATVMDRMIGLLALIFIAVCLIVLRYDWLTQGFELPPIDIGALFTVAGFKAYLTLIPLNVQFLYLLIVILVVCIGSIGFSFVITGLNLVDRLPARFPGRAHFVELAQAYNAYAKAWGTSLLAFALALPVHFISFLVFYFAARAFGVVPPIVDFFAIMPIINTITALPISLSGVGVREVMFESLLALSLVPGAKSTLISMAGFLTMLAWGLIGGVINLFYRPSQMAVDTPSTASTNEVGAA